jgi:pimeloyl-ACP methyl ester carboxylesterase
MPYVRTRDTSIYYETHGEGPAILFVHGSGGNHAAWWQQTSHFMPKHRVITMDLRGFGNSDTIADGPDSQDFPDDILAVLEDAKVERAVLLGQSIGAAAALKAALVKPAMVAGVVLAHSLGGIHHPAISPLVKADRAEAEKLPVLDRLLTKHFQRSEPAKTFLFRQMGTFNAAKMQDLRNLSVAGPSVEQVVAAGVRVWFLAGERDAVLRPATVAAAQALVPGSRLSIVPDAPHSMYWEAPALFNAAVDACLSEFYA